MTLLSSQIFHYLIDNRLLVGWLALAVSVIIGDDINNTFHKWRIYQSHMVFKLRYIAWHVTARQPGQLQVNAMKTKTKTKNKKN